MTPDAHTAQAGAPAPVAYKDPRVARLPECSDEPAWFAALSTLEPTPARTLLAVLRTLYPHDRLPDAVYRRVVVAFDRIACTSPALREQLAGFIVALDSATPLPFADLSESYRVTTLKQNESAPAFRFVQRTGVRYLYDDIEVWEAFGYEGASYHLGGYVQRGFDDLDWLLPLPTVSHGGFP